ncbi:MAG: ATP-binding protein [Methylococcales bacterium]|nr:ATP-binding protein [Methylococcales bacterium]
MKWQPKSLFGRLFLLIIGFMILNFILLRMVYIVLVAEPGGQQIAYFTESLATLIKEVEVRGTIESNRQFAESLQQRTGMKLIWNTDQQWNKPPNLPYYRALEKTLTETWKDSLTSRFQSEPNSVFWLLHSTAPQFSIGIPLLDHMALWKYLAWGGLFVIIFSMISAYFAARYLKTSLHDLAEGANLLGFDNSSHIIKPSGPNEVRNVAQAMNTMRENLERMIKKQEFLLTGISHDLRTPLTRIRVATRLIGADEKGYIDGINSDIEEMDVVLHRFIELAQLNIKESEPWEIGDITPLIQDVAAKYRQSKINLTLSLSNLPVVRYKPMTLQRYLYNLINNSMKHGGGQVTISTRTFDDFVEVSVADQGPGIPLLTGLLTTYSDLNKDQEHGNGLGLRIVQLIANVQQAELMALNKPEGGAEVILKLKACVEVA